MAHHCELDGITIEAQADEAAAVANGMMLRGREVTLELPFAPVRFYRHGWQSWSLTTWQGTGERIPRSKPALLLPMQTDPRYARDDRPNGSWVGAVELPDGRILLLASIGLETHVALEGNRLSGWCEAGPVKWLVTVGTESEAFNRYASAIQSALGRGRAGDPPRVWCSWYSLHAAIGERILHRVIGQVTGMPFEVFQVDDGWQARIGDWEANDKFPSGMEALAARIRDAGFVPGLWLAPLLAVPSSRLHREHPEWLLRDGKGKPVPAGFNWGEPLHALDDARPEVLAWLASLMRKVRAWGFSYAKLDFLYAGALPGVRGNGMPREAAYRNALRVMREALGDAYLLACGAPVVPSVGLCDALRVGPDVAAARDVPRDSRLLANHATPGARNAVRTTVHRLWLDPLFHVDPDVVYFRTHRCGMHSAEKGLLRDLASVCGFRATSDIPGWLEPQERADLLAFLASRPRVRRTGRYTFAVDGRPVDFSAAVPLPAPMRLAGALVGWLAGRRWVLRLFDRLQRRSLARMVQEDFSGS
ncbi:MAG: alpha-galactosidase [Spirochaetes bacterium]|nr:alpha-galactosidase [Spirochaetota bacterium]